MDLEEFLKRERDKLQKEKNRLLAEASKGSTANDAISSKSSKYGSEVNEESIAGENVPQHTEESVDDLNIELPMSAKSSMATARDVDSQTTDKEQERRFAKNNPFEYYDNLVNSVEREHNLESGKDAKNLANERKIENASSRQTSAEVNSVRSKSRAKKDDMEQWVSDTFYNYFPSFNDESKKRQILLRDKQLENQQNYLKKMSEVAQSSRQEKAAKRIQIKKPQPTRADKTELEIIVNNPNYETPKEPIRPDSTRHRLLQDLRHTELSNMMYDDGVLERNRLSAEKEIEKKKSYQTALMKQIEEKRRQIEMLKEKERMEEEALTRKLEQQLKTIDLEEQFEREKLRADKVRFESEQNQIMREQLLTKLENDKKLFAARERESKSENDKESLKTPEDSNRVYKYFSNSARREYNRRSRDSDETFDNEMEFGDGLDEEEEDDKNCYHPTTAKKRLCPFCRSTLKNYENVCLKCDAKIKDDGVPNRTLVCESCERRYSICSGCEERNGSCSYCRRKRNICSNCIQNLCLHCGNKVRRGKTRGKDKPSSERSFQILELSYPASEDDLAENMNNFYERNRQPFSMNIDKNSIFHPDRKIDDPKYEVNIQNGNISVNKLYDDSKDIEEVQTETNERLSRYLKNYGDLAMKRDISSRNRSTQTTPGEKEARKHSPNPEYTLSMPLLRQTPKHKDSTTDKNQKRKEGTGKMMNLECKWEVPAVQRQIISTGSPKVLTQLGAIRKQLQSDALQLGS